MFFVFVCFLSKFTVEADTLGEISPKSFIQSQIITKSFLGI